MDERFRFCKLDVWKKAIAYADAIYDVTAKFPDTEKFGLAAASSLGLHFLEHCRGLQPFL